MTFEGLLQEELSALENSDLLRRLKILEPKSQTNAFWNGKPLVLFCGNDYLGFSRHPRVIEKVRFVVGEQGVGAGAARLISGSTEIHQRLEQSLAKFRKKDKALVFSAGYLANLGVLAGLADERDLIVMDKLCHASLIDGARLSQARIRVFPHKNYERCAEILKKSKGYRRRLLVSDSVFSMDGDIADIASLVELKRKFETLLILDDAHGMGVLGENGSGAAEGREDDVDIITGTLSKSLGCQGGFAAASGDIIDYLINFSRPFIFSTALSPALAAAAFEALSILQEEPEARMKLWKNIHTLKDLLTAEGMPVETSSAIFPIMVGAEKKALDLSERLLQSGYLVPAVRYPSVSKGKARLRVTVSASHKREELVRFAACAGSLCRQSN